MKKEKKEFLFFDSKAIMFIVIRVDKISNSSVAIITVFKSII